jgi:hypothetical protein
MSFYEEYFVFLYIKYFKILLKALVYINSKTRKLSNNAASSNPLEAENILKSFLTNIISSASVSNISKEVKMRNLNKQTDRLDLSKTMYLEDNMPVFDGDNIVY